MAFQLLRMFWAWMVKGAYIWHLAFPMLMLLEAKAKALEEAVDFAWDIGVHFECDSKLIVDAVFGVSSP